MTARLLLLTLGAALLMATPAPVQARPGLTAAQIAGIPIGCWQTRTRLYGAYAIAFCLGESGVGSYRVQGDGHDCQGGASWAVDSSRNGIIYRMQRGACTAAAEWTADRVECHLGRDSAGNVQCTYFPNAPGYNPVRFEAYPQQRR